MILNDFKNKYNNLKLEVLKDEEFKRVIHTLKGLSLNIGAVRLNMIVEALESTPDKELLRALNSELGSVMEELNDILKIQSANQSSKS